MNLNLAHQTQLYLGLFEREIYPFTAECSVANRNTLHGTRESLRGAFEDHGIRDNSSEKCLVAPIHTRNASDRTQQLVFCVGGVIGVISLFSSGSTTRAATRTSQIGDQVVDA
jgi:hypothetical protein